MANSKEFFIASLIVLIASLGLVLAQDYGLTDSKSAKVEAESVKYLGLADEKFIDIAKDYIKRKLGEDYYKRFVKFKSAASYEYCKKDKCNIRNVISFDYEIPFEVSGDPTIGGPVLIEVILNKKGEVTSYIGPVKPYQFLISKEEAIEKAKSYGLKETTSAGIATTEYKDGGYEIIWAVSSNDIIGYGDVMGEPLYKGVYIDVESGEVLGEYSINPLIASSGRITNANLGNFFNDEEIVKGGGRLRKEAISPVQVFVLAAIVVAILLIIFALNKGKKSR